MAPFSGKLLEQALIELLRDKMPLYLEEYLPGVQHPRSYMRRNRVDRWAEDQLPSIVVASVGLTGDRPQKTRGGDDGREMFITHWGFGIGAIVMSSDQESTRDIAEDYAAIARTLILHNKSLTGIAEDTTWVDESFDEMFIQEMERTLLASVVLFSTQINVPTEPKPREIIRTADSVTVDVRPKED
jgi:hypothetical protein